MADANHSAPFIFQDCFVDRETSSHSRRIVPHLRLTDMSPPVVHLWMKLSGRWIEAAGFDPEQRLQIEVSHQRLVITPLDAAGSDAVGKHGFPAVEPATERQPRQCPVTTGDAR